ncbi:hypothetical protein CI109_105380 [Kwoniella shandongensis]|uniref:Uncharacterized protein n=1 Tax=Kwoniella shandongensis TaxID=1734106 RepID=A0A5M6BTK1_9TREE|nr:uncharacterized protein CI109_006321 [Kwoniella shandongensis]KAA5525342.1 hypothetical protein CI109_006321 [Kwoniella shandongensis]
MSPPRGGSVPIPAVPVPTSGENQQVGRKKSTVLQSSLELVFSYSRSQQQRYGHLPSAPSFIDGYSSSRSRSTPDQAANPDGGYYDDDEEYEPQGGGSSRWDDLESGSAVRRAGQLDVNDIIDEVDFVEDDEEASGMPGQDGVGAGDDPYRITGARRASEEPSFFHSDPVPPAPSGLVRQNQDPSASPSTVSQTTGTGGAGRGLISLNMFSPLSASAQLGTSYGTGSSGSQTPNLGSTRGRGGGRVFSGSERGRKSMTGTGERTVLIDRRESAVARGYDAMVDGDVVGVGEIPGRRKSVVKKSKKDQYLFRGESTDGQTLFNATAVLVGIGLLSLPLAFAYAGWIGGTAMLVIFGWLTCYTAKLLARLIRADGSLMGYTDIGLRAFGSWAGAGINVLFCLELFALGVALVVLFGDTMNALYPDVSSNTWKMLGYFVILPTALLPLRLLSLPSLLSSVSSLLLVLVLLIDGFIRPVAPGSIRQPMETKWGPEWQGANWLGAIGLVLAGFGGHAVMPSLARDMKKPENFDKIINKAFAIATSISFVAGAAGYLMIGQTVSDEITRDLMQEKYHYPKVLNLVALWMIVINPLTKFGLASRPLNLTIEGILGISRKPVSPVIEDSNFEIDRELVDPLASGKSDHPRTSSFSIHPSNDSSSVPNANVHRRSSSISPNRARPRFDSDYSITQSAPSQSQIAFAVKQERRKSWLRVISRTFVTAMCVITAVNLPGFGRVMAFLGSFSAFLICIILPLLFYLRLSPILLQHENEKHDWRKRVEKAGHWIMVIISIGFMIAGTVWAFLPGSGHGELEQ